MSPVLSRWLVPGLLFLLMLGSGLWLNQIGRPWNVVVLTLHKLIALGGVIWAGCLFYGLLRVAPPTGLAVALVVVAAACVVALFATGAFLSQNKPILGLYLVVHQVAPALGVLSTAAAAYLLAASK